MGRSTTLLGALALGAAAVSATSAAAAGPAASRPVRLTDAQLDGVVAAGLAVAEVTASAAAAGGGADTSTETLTHVSEVGGFRVALGTGHALAVGDAPGVELSSLVHADGDTAFAVGFTIGVNAPSLAAGHAVAFTIAFDRPALVGPLQGNNAGGVAGGSGRRRP